MVSGLVGQLVVLVLGLIIPRIMISSYGSDTNGLISTITQVFTYMALLEAGIGQAAKNALFKPIAENDRQRINSVLSTAKSYFAKVTRYYALGVLLLAFVAPFFLKTNVSRLTVFFLILFEGLSGVVTFYYIQTPIVLLNSDGRSYVNNYINLANKILGYVVKIMMAVFGLNIVLIQVVYFFITVAKVVVYRWYLHRNYNWIDMSVPTNTQLLQDRNSYILTEMAWTIFSSTDMIVLSTFISTQLSSVYSVYNMVFVNIHVLLNSVATSINYVLGKTYHEGLKKYEIIHDSFTSIYLGIMTILMSVSYVLIVPFIQLYTHGVADVNYIYTSLPLMFCLIQLLSWSRNVTGNLTGVAGYAKTTSYVSLVEAVINLSLSMVFVKKFGIVGVLLATVVALPLKVIWCIYISDKKVLNRSYKNTFKIL